MFILFCPCKLGLLGYGGVANVDRALAVGLLVIWAENIYKLGNKWVRRFLCVLHRCELLGQLV